MIFRRLIVQVAQIARRFHDAGYNHRDFNCYHFLIKELSGDCLDFRNAGGCLDFRVSENGTVPFTASTAVDASTPAPSIFDLRLIDLQRMQHRRWFRRRWIVKDLAQLVSTAPADRVSCRDKVLFLHHYLGVRKLRPADRQLIRSVLWKQSLIERRARRKP